MALELAVLWDLDKEGEGEAMEQAAVDKEKELGTEVVGKESGRKELDKEADKEADKETETALAGPNSSRRRFHHLSQRPRCELFQLLGEAVLPQPVRLNQEVLVVSLPWPP